jgi:hypothetical protein
VYLAPLGLSVVRAAFDFAGFYIILGVIMFVSFCAYSYLSPAVQAYYRKV